MCYIYTGKTMTNAKLASPACGKRVPATFQATLPGLPGLAGSGIAQNFPSIIVTYANISLKSLEIELLQLSSYSTTNLLGDRGLHPLQTLFFAPFGYTSCCEDTGGRKHFAVGCFGFSWV
jgi:hypothetical protein